MNKHDRVQALAKSAFASMAERDVAPMPKNYELFYTYAAEENPVVMRILKSLINSGETITQENLDAIYNRFFTSAHLTRAMDHAGTNLFNAVNDVMAQLGVAKNDAAAYGRTLSTASGDLGGSQTPEQIREFLGGLISATQFMETRTKTLEADLEVSSQKISDLKHKLDDVRRESLTDPLTGIANRKAFDNELDRAIAAAREDGQPLTVCMIDIDHFKKFNDQWGHQTGDNVLRIVSQCLSDNVKGRDTAARYGGEEFVLVLPHTTLDDSVVLADKIRATVELKKLVKKSTGEALSTITISAGVALLGPNDTATTVTERADACLYAAKRSGRNRVTSEADQIFVQQVDAA